MNTHKKREWGFNNYEREIESVLQIDPINMAHDPDITFFFFFFLKEPTAH